MNAREAIRGAIDGGHMICNAYLQDLTDEELLVRPAEKSNHIAWQLGHLISSEHSMVEAVCPGSMPPLPDGFADKYTTETSRLDDPSAFHSKSEYLRLHEEQRAGTLAALNALTDDDLDRPAPEPLRSFAPRVADVFGMQATHWLMHGGQWAIVRRQLGRDPLF